MSLAMEPARRALAATGRQIHGRGWCPATSGNFSQRLDAHHCAITCSGRDKALLQESDIMAVNLEGQAVTEGRPSAEAALHTQLYRLDADIGAVLHTHSHACTVLTMHCLDEALTLSGYELLKALSGVTTHEASVTLPVFENTQNIDALADQVQPQLSGGLISHGYMIRGHGLYTWGADLRESYRHLEALETLLAIELDRRRLRP